MGTEVHCKSSFEGYYSMRDVNEDSNSSSWPLFYGDNKGLTNGHYYNGFVPRTVADAYPGCDKEAIKQKMLEHEAIFKNQVLKSLHFDFCVSNITVVLVFWRRLNWKIHYKSIRFKNWQEFGNY